MSAPVGEHAVVPCGSCAAPVIWGATERGKKVAVDAEPSPRGVVKLLARTFANTPLVVTVKTADRFGRIQLYTTHGTPCRRTPR